MRTRYWLLSVAALSLIATLAVPVTALAQQAAPAIPNPGNQNMFQLNDLASYRQFS